MTWSQSHRSSILQVSWRQLRPFSCNVAVLQSCKLRNKNRQPKKIHHRLLQGRSNKQKNQRSKKSTAANMNDITDTKKGRTGIAPTYLQTTQSPCLHSILFDFRCSFYISVFPDTGQYNSLLSSQNMHHWTLTSLLAKWLSACPWFTPPPTSRPVQLENWSDLDFLRLISILPECWRSFFFFFCLHDRGTGPDFITLLDLFLARFFLNFPVCSFRTKLATRQLLIAR